MRRRERETAAARTGLSLEDLGQEPYHLLRVYFHFAFSKSARTKAICASSPQVPVFLWQCRLAESIRLWFQFGLRLASPPSRVVLPGGYRFQVGRPFQ